jgi:hypothetical protein
MTTTVPGADAGYIRPELADLIVPILEVRPWPGNPRRGNHRVIRDSLLSHGQYKPLAAQRSTGYLVLGNNTWHVMRTMGYTHAAVSMLDVDDDAARRILAMDNASSDAADYDLPALGDFLAAMPDYNGTGWTTLKVDALLAELQGGAGVDTLPDVADVLPPTEPTGPPLPPRPTADPFTHPTAAQPPTPTAAQPPDVTSAPIKSPPEPHPTRTELPPAGPPTTRPPGPPPDADVPWVLTIRRADRDEAHRLIAHARDWLTEPDATPADIVIRALRTLAAVGDARHNPTTTISMTTLLMAAGRDPFTGR